MPKSFVIKNRQPTIFRVIKNKDNPYVMIDRRPIDNSLLSFKAKGILTYILSRPDGWEVNVPDLVNHSTDGASAIRSGLKELKALGHMRYNPSRTGGYISKWVIEIFELPELNPDFGKASENDGEGDKVLDDDFLQVENLQVENRTQLSNELKASNELKVYTGAKKKKPDPFETLAQFERIAWEASKTVRKGWKHRHMFENDDRQAALADMAVFLFGEPMKSETFALLHSVKNLMDNEVTPLDLKEAVEYAKKIWSVKPTGVSEGIVRLARTMAIERRQNASANQNTESQPESVSTLAGRINANRK